MTALEDESAQQLGFIGVIFGDPAVLFGERGSMMRSVARKAHMLREGVPFRFTCVHYCYDDIRLRWLMSVVLKLVSTKGRLRFRPHFGA